MARQVTVRLATLFFATLVALLIGEVIVRLVGESDADGQFYLLERQLRPYKLPVARNTELLDTYLAAPSSYIVYDPYLGWRPRPNTVSKNGLYRSNSAGLRADREYEMLPEQGTVRIALFGDSFTHGDDVGFEDSWGHQLERELGNRGLEVEVLNFGVSGYGIDQAYLRWRCEGREYAPDIVLFGFQAENVLRNLSLFQTIYYRQVESPFSKPRFVLEDERLRLVNSPTVPLEQVPSTLAGFADSPLAEYEYYYDDSYTTYWWLNSRLLAVLAYATSGPYEANVWHGPQELIEQERFYDLNGQSGRLALAIIEAFENDVTTHGADFVVVHLPAQIFLSQIREGRPVPYADMLAYLDEHYTVVHGEDSMKDLSAEAYYIGTWHYTPIANRVIAEMAADTIYDRAASLANTPDSKQSSVHQLGSACFFQHGTTGLP